MKIVTLITTVVSIASCLSPLTSTAEPAPHALADEWEFVGEMVNEPGYHIWGSSPMQTKDGKTHLFAARWKKEARFVPGWHTHCEIARYVAKSSEGPFKFAEVVITGSGIKDRWDKQAPHNPNIQKIGNHFVLTYIANKGNPFPASQTIGMLISKNIDGPWKPANGDATKPMLAPPQNTLTSGVTNQKWASITPP